MDIFETSRAEAYSKIQQLGDFICTGSEELAFYRGVQAHIEALKEMMVGEPIRGNLRHSLIPQGSPYTYIYKPGIKGPPVAIALWDGHHGTAGEEVVAFVVRLVAQQNFKEEE